MDKRDIPLDQAIALVRAAQKLNCDTGEKLHEAMARRIRERYAAERKIQKAINREEKYLYKLLRSKAVGSIMAGDVEGAFHRLRSALEPTSRS